MKTIAGLCVYREAGTIRSAIDSISPYFDKVVVWDGRFTDHPELPDDGTAEIVADLQARDPGKIVYVPTEPMTEVDKRNLMFDYCEDGDLLLIIDGDEVAVGDVKAGLGFAKLHGDKKSVFWVNFIPDDERRIYSGYAVGWRPRIIRVRKGMHYTQRHDCLFWPDGSMVVDYQKYPTTWKDERFCESGCNAIIHEFNLTSAGIIRTRERINARNRYFEKLEMKGWHEAHRPRIIAGYMAYQAAKVIERSLGPLLPYVDGVILMDGPLYNPKPDDGTTDLVRQMCKKAGKPLVVDSEQGVEFDVRSKMLTHVPDGDLLFMLDADEISMGDVGKMFDTVRANPQVSIFWIQVDENYFDVKQQVVWKPKIFKVFKGYHFYPNHWTLCDASYRIVTDWGHHEKPDWRDITEITLKNLGAEGSPESAKQRADNYRTIFSVGDPHADPNWELKVKEKMGLGVPLSLPSVMGTPKSSEDFSQFLAAYHYWKKGSLESPLEHLRNHPAKIWVVMCAWQENEKMLREALAPVLPYVDGVVLANVRFAWFKPTTPDDPVTVPCVTRLCEEFGKPLILEQRPGYEYEVRTNAIKHVPTGDYAFVLDGDEIVLGDVAGAMELIRAAEFDDYPLHVEGYNTPDSKIYSITQCQRIFVMTSGMRYHEDHWTLCDGEHLVCTVSAMRFPYTSLKLGMIELRNRPLERGPLQVADHRRRYDMLNRVNWDELQLPAVVVSEPPTHHPVSTPPFLPLDTEGRGSD